MHKKNTTVEKMPLIKRGLKTVTINVSHVYGTKAGMCVCASYRNKQITSVTGHEAGEESMFEAAKKVAKGLGFTHYKMRLNGIERKL